VAQGEAINAAASIGGRPVVVPRISFADSRERHRGVSHHTLAALTRIAMAPAYVTIPSLPDGYAAAVEDAFDEAGVFSRHRRVDGLRVVAPPMRGLEVRSMGRSEAEDPAFFAAAYAAGDTCVRIAHGEEL
ncbi:MAG: DUF3866 family protein, partial [Coriobacteriia bacterium]|nr:DUF3866 family protein [Coriobacteriia bacterium]